MNINVIKWTSTFFVLTGILMAQFEMYPYYIFAHSLGAAGWLTSGYLMTVSYTHLTLPTILLV